MKFCPKCDVRLKKDGSSLKCTQCGYSQGGAGPSAQPKAADPEVSELNVLDEGEGQETLPTIKKECEKCGHGEAVWWMLQTRSADEPTTQFYRCIKCSHTWRDYS